MQAIEIKTAKRTEFIDITALVQAGVAELKRPAGLVTVFIPHTTAGLMINENADPAVLADIERALENMVPWNGNYSHGEGNAAAHVKAALLGAALSVPVENGRLQLGAWQGIFFCEFDGPRRRKVWLV